MICLSCKAPNPEAAQFCNGCGVDLRKHNQPASLEDEITQHRFDRAPAATIVDRDGDPLLGSTVARKYRIEAKLGAGGMGVVYRARPASLLCGTYAQPWNRVEDHHHDPQ